MESRLFPTWSAALYLIVQESHSISAPSCGEELNSNPALHHCRQETSLRAGIFIGNRVSKIIYGSTLRHSFCMGEISSWFWLVAPPVANVLRQGTRSDLDLYVFILFRRLHLSGRKTSAKVRVRGLKQMTTRWILARGQKQEV